MKSVLPRTPQLALYAALLSACGCSSVPGPPAADVNSYLRSPSSVLRLHRVVFISLDDTNCPPDIAQDMTDALAGTIRSRRLFRIERIEKTDPACDGLPLDVRGAMSMRQMEQIRAALNCDAVMFGRVDHFQTHPRMQIGIYVRLIDLTGGDLVWGVDHTWDSTDKQTAERIEHFFGEEMRSGYDPVQWRLGLVSPKIFEKFIAYEAADTLPTRVGPAEPKKTPAIWPKVRDAVRQVDNANRS